MAGSEDIEIQIKVKVEEAMKNLKNLEKNITTTTKSMGSNLKPVVTSTGKSIKQLAQDTGMLGNGFTMLKGALSGVVAMVGYQLASGLIESTRASINARGNIEAFSKRLKMSGQEVQKFQGDLAKLQGEFRKVDMQQVGATALETANKLGVPKDKLGDLSKMTAVMSSSFLREGRTSEDAILAVNDALDGQFKRLQEIGISQDTLKANGWNGNVEDTANLIDALNKSMDSLGLTETAKQVTNLDDAWQVLNVSLSQLLTELILPLVPALVAIVGALSDAAVAVKDWWSNMPDAAKIALISAAVGALAYVIGSYLVAAFFEFTAAVAASEVALLPLIVTILEVAAVVGAVVFVIYEVGKAMGWWTDTASAMQVVSEALQNAFNTLVACLQAVYNGFMEVVSPALTEFWNYLVEAVKPLGEMFGILQQSLGELGAAFGGASGSGSLFADIGRVIGMVFTGLLDQVRMVVPVVVFFITGIVAIINVFVKVITGLKQAFDLLMSADIGGFFASLGQIISDGLAGLADMIASNIPDLPTIIGMAWDFTPLGLVFNNLLPMLMPYISQFGLGLLSSFRNVVLNIVGAFTGIVTGIRMRLTQAWSIAGSLVTRIRQMIITRFNVLVASVSQIFTRIVNSIRSKLTSAASAARQKALAIYNSIKEKVSQVPDIVKQEFDKIKDRIKTAIDNAKNTAYTAITDLVNTVKRALGIASPGFIQRMFTYEFTSIPGIIQDGGVVAVNEAGKMARNVVSAWNDNMSPFTVPSVESIVPQFNSMSLANNNMDLATLSSNMNGIVGGVGGNRVVTTNNNDNSSTVINIDLNRLPHDEKEQWWNMLQTISRGA